MARDPFTQCSVMSSLAGVEWPAVPDAAGAQALALQFQLEQTQWWSPAELEYHQMQQLQLLLRHACHTIPFWQQRLAACGYHPGATVTHRWLSMLPVLTRNDVRDRSEALLSSASPPAHGSVVKGQILSSTGRPIAYYRTGLTQALWRSIALRDHLWHRRDFGGTLAVIQPNVDNTVLPGWGSDADAAFVTGPRAVLNIATDIDAQLEWLRKHNPDSVLTLPSNLYALVRRAAELGVRLDGLREARTFGETVPRDLRSLCRDVWKVPVSDLYLAKETGYIALQCPEHEQYHVQSESVLVEVLDERSNACVPGQAGRVVVTTLHNFAMPLIRYDLGDYAELGEPCACGRGLPVLRRIIGRAGTTLMAATESTTDPASECPTTC